MIDLEFQVFWTLVFSALAVLVFVLIMGFGLKNAGKRELERFVTAFDKDFRKNSLITDHALVRFEQHRYDRARWEVFNAIRSAVTLSFCFVGLAFAPSIGNIINDWDGSLRVMFVLFIVVFIVIGLPEIAERWYRKYRFDVTKHQQPQWNYMTKIADRYGVNLDVLLPYKENLTHLRTSLEAIGYRAARKLEGTDKQ